MFFYPLVSIQRHEAENSSFSSCRWLITGIKLEIMANWPLQKHFPQIKQTSLNIQQIKFPFIWRKWGQHSRHRHSTLLKRKTPSSTRALVLTDDSIHAIISRAHFSRRLSMSSWLICIFWQLFLVLLLS